jgi:hypothetical protein
MLDHERPLEAALAQSEEERQRQRQARWERDRDILRTLGSQKPVSNSL